MRMVCEVLEAATPTAVRDSKFQREGVGYLLGFLHGIFNYEKWVGLF
jgi:hypothetical protein